MLFEYLEAAMRRHADKTVRDETRTMTYRELVAAAKACGDQLSADKYGLLCRSDLDTAVGLLACLYAGKTAVPLSHRYGEEHTRRILAGMGVSRIIGDGGRVERVGKDRAEVEDLADVALLMCTSGTTGQPKGAMITYRNLLTNLNDIAGYFDLYNTDRILIARPLYHCAVLTGEFLVSLLKGLDIVFQSGSFNPVRVMETVERQRITVLCGTPTLFHHLSRLAAQSPHDGPLRVIALSGECLPERTARRIRAGFPHADIYHVYGLTEASPRVSCLLPAWFDRIPTSVGRPLPSLRARIVDGELLVRGDSVMKGYYGDPEATRRVLADGWLHTGDIAAMDEDGRLTIQCRKDDLIIRAGMNLYPREIEEALEADPRIREVLAFGVADPAAGQRIHLHAVAPGLTKAALYDLCRAVLPAYQLPDAIELVDALPRNASGKLIRRKGGVPIGTGV